MPLAIGRLVLLALSCSGPLRGTICASEKRTAGRSRQIDAEITSSDLTAFSEGFLDGFTHQPAIDGRPPQIGFRRPHRVNLQKRDCLSNGTNFCFGDDSNYCSSCGVCCSSPSNSNNKWCCPSDASCCGSTCCGSGQTCNNGKCYLPIETVTSISAVSVTSTYVVTGIVTILQKVVESVALNSVITVTNTDEQTQTNWAYVTVTSVGKRSVPTEQPNIGHHIDAIRNGLVVEPTSTVPPLKLATLTPTPESTQELIRRQQADNKDTMAVSQSTTTVEELITTTAVVTSTLSSTTTALTTSTIVETLFQTQTIALNAKETVAATSTLTFTSHHPVTLTVTEVATIHHASGTAAMSSTSSSTTPSLITGLAGAKDLRKGLSSSAIAGIAVGVSIFALTAGMLIFFFARRHHSRKKQLRAISEDYAYLGTGRSDGTEAGIGRSSSHGAVLKPNPSYPSPPSSSVAVLPSIGQPISRRLTLQSDDHGLPPTPNFTRVPTKRSANSSTSATSASSPTAASPPAFAFTSSDPLQQLSPNQYNSNNRMAHIRSGSAQTNGTTASSTAVGDGSARDSIQSVADAQGKIAALMVASGGTSSHNRASSSGGGSGITIETLAEHEIDDTADAATGNVPCVELPYQPVQQNSPDPPSPTLEPRLGPLRVVNTPATLPAVPDAPEPDDLKRSEVRSP